MIFYALFIFIFGLAIGSFLNVLIDRLPQGRSIMGRSHCEFCHTNIVWYDLIPVFSYIFLGGKCRKCKEKFGIFYPSVEFLTGSVFAMIFLSADPSFVAIYLLMASSLIVIFFADLKYQIIPDSMQVLFFLSVVALKFISPQTVAEIPKQIQNNLIAGILVALPILLLFLLTKGKGMGFGDVKYTFTVGFLLGIKGGLIAIYIAFILGAVVGIFLLATKRKKLRSKIAFGPFLVLGTVSVLIWGTLFFDWFRLIYGV